MTDVKTAPTARSADALAIGCFATLCRDRLADQLLTFSRMAPPPDLGVHELALTEILPAVREGRVTLAIAPEDLADEALAAMPLWSEEAVVALAPDHPLAAARRVTPAALMDAVTLLSGDRAEAEMQRFLIARLFPGARPPIDAAVRSGETAWTRVAAGEGVALTLASHELPAGVVTRPIAAVAARFAVQALWRADHRSAPLATLLRLLHGAAVAAA